LENEQEPNPLEIIEKAFQNLSDAGIGSGVAGDDDESV
jgi:hypothetical protein